MSKNEITLAKALERVIEFKKCIKEDLEANKGDACFIEDLEVINFIERTLRNYDRQSKELNKLQETRKNLFKIIERKEAEIKQWKTEANQYQNLWLDAYPEAIKELEAKINEKLHEAEMHGNFEPIVTREMFDSVLKEMGVELK